MHNLIGVLISLVLVGVLVTLFGVVWLIGIVGARLMDVLND